MTRLNASMVSFVTSPDTLSGRPFDLSTAFPTPSNGGVRFSALLPRRGRVRLQIFDLQGRSVWTDDRSFGRGTRSLAWPGTDAHGLRVRPGLYFARIEYEERAYLRRIVLIP